MTQEQNWWTRPLCSEELGESEPVAPEVRAAKRVEYFLWQFFTGDKDAEIAKGITKEAFLREAGWVEFSCTVADVARALKQTTAKQRKAMALYFSGNTFRSVSRAWGVHHETVRRLTRRALRDMGQFLSEGVCQ